ncbi:MAG: hypothetical protein ACI9IL_001071, partial [Rickettsiales bacterium]
MVAWYYQIFLNKKMKSHNILFLGYGYVAQYFCKSYHLDGFNLGASI